MFHCFCAQHKTTDRKRAKVTFPEKRQWEGSKFFEEGTILRIEDEFE